MQPIKEFADRIREGKVGTEDAARITANIWQSPIIPAVLTQAFEKKYILTPEVPEFFKKKGRLTISRFIRAIMSKKVSEQQLADVLNIITTREVKNNHKTYSLKEELSQEELQNCLKTMDAVCQALNIPDQPYTFNLADEMRKIINGTISTAAPSQTH